MSQPLPRGALYALGAAALFGASTPVSKLLVQHASPQGVAALLYLGSGVGLAAMLAVKRWRGDVLAPIPRGARLRFAGAILFGGVLAPLLLLVGLTTTAGSTAALLLNLEGVFTVLIAWLVMRENVDRRLVFGMAAILAAGICLAWEPGTAVPFSKGALAVVGACLCWGIDNTLTQACSSADPALVACLKGLVAGATNLAIAFALGAALPTLDVTAATMALGFVAYGLSLVLFVLALRNLGSARTAAYFAAAPFIGAALSFVVLHEPWTMRFAVGAALMLVGVWLHLTEQHEHEHAHDALLHNHEHVHDEHHQHAHEPGVVVSVLHTHEHVHDALVHSHAHTPDIHHRHEHEPTR